MTIKSLGGIFARCVITVTLMVLGCWLSHHNWQMRRIRYGDYSFTDQEAGKLSKFPAAQYAYGMRDWFRGDAEKASEFFRQAVSEDPLYMDAWLRLAESEAALGNLEKSADTFLFL